MCSVSPPDVESKQECTRVIERCQLGTNFLIYKFHPFATPANAARVVKVKHTLVLDNSGSMGGYTKQALEQIGAPLFDMANTVPGTLILFDSKVVVFDDLKDSSQLKAIVLPPQGATDITTAIQRAVHLIGSEEDKTIHHVLTFLSDGQHNSGPALHNFEELKLQIGSLCKLSVIVVGISACDTSLGMRMKIELETAAIPGLESIYFAKTHGDFETVPLQLLSGMEAFFVGGHLHGVRFADSGEAVFLDSSTYQTSIYLHQVPRVLVARCKGSELPILYVDDIQVQGKDIGQLPHSDLEAGIQSFFDFIIPKLSQLKVAHNGNMARLEPYLAQLSELLQCTQTIMAMKMKGKEVEDIPEFDGERNEEYRKLPANTRLRILRKKLKGAELFFQTEMNRIEQLRAVVQNSSSAQAAYLTGMTKKYAAKAVLRTDTVNVTVSDALAKLRTEILPKLELSLVGDDDKKEVQASILSCNTAKEQLADWVITLNSPNLEADKFENIYSLLVAFGFVGYPIKFVHNNAVQMDPFQTRCLAIETVPIDSCTLMFAQQLGKSLRSPNSNNPLSDCLVLVDCTCPQASLIALRSEVYKFLASCCLCRDLFMYHPKMTFSLHAHAFLRSMREYQNLKGEGGEHFVNLAVKIVYSMRKVWCGFENSENKSLFTRWFEEWGGVSQSALDNCNHPVQLPLLLACLGDEKDFVSNTEDCLVPMLNLFNEVLARELKGWLIGKTSASATPNLRATATTVLQGLFGITPDNSPKPLDDVLSDEPTIESVRDSCQMYADFNESLFQSQFGMSLDEYINCTLRPYYLAYQLALKLHNLHSLEGDMEKCGEVPAQLQQSLHKSLLSFKTLPCVDPKIMVTMFAQSLLFHDNASRGGIVDHDVQHPATLQAIIVELRLAHYLEACRFKQSEYSKIIGDYSLQEGIRVGSVEFGQLLGGHTHGLSRAKFWAYHGAACLDPEKRLMFIQKSNGTVTFRM